jgi:hypothetical protein
LKISEPLGSSRHIELFVLLIHGIPRLHQHSVLHSELSISEILAALGRGGNCFFNDGFLRSLWREDLKSLVFLQCKIITGFPLRRWYYKLSKVHGSLHGSENSVRGQFLLGVFEEFTLFV